MSSVSIYNKHYPDSDFQGQYVLNAGCGNAQYDAANVVNLDAYSSCRPDVVWDLNKTPLPFADNTFDLILANHILEHLTDFWSCFEEFARIVKPNGRIEVYVPATGTDAAMGFRDHVRIVNNCSFYGVNGTSRGVGNAWAEEQLNSPATRLRMVSDQTVLENFWWLNRFTRKFAAKHLRNVIREKGYIFRKLTEEEWINERRTDFDARVLSLRKVAVSK